MTKLSRPFLPFFHRSRHRSIFFHACPRSPICPPFPSAKNYHASKERTNVTKKTSSRSIASAHPTIPSGNAWIPSTYPKGLSNDNRKGFTYAELSGQHPRTSSRQTYRSRAHIRNRCLIDKEICFLQRACWAVAKGFNTTQMCVACVYLSCFYTCEASIHPSPNTTRFLSNLRDKN
ncbi:hypothetical protein B9Z19DRAFT_221172 [Tuber borchii]|uniref:Uncharacterized protein n=1 Tax=Tuber borchii TaxID=42251 RepID=A0A2T6ZMX4_TUBBO|nr:hypothetical protein B9Z19DRAFT_221172 [Tuber borchii]